MSSAPLIPRISDCRDRILNLGATSLPFALTSWEEEMVVLAARNPANEDDLPALVFDAIAISLALKEAALASVATDDTIGTRSLTRLLETADRHVGKLQVAIADSTKLGESAPGKEIQSTRSRLNALRASLIAATEGAGRARPSADGSAMRRQTQSAPAASAAASSATPPTAASAALQAAADDPTYNRPPSTTPQPRSRARGWLLLALVGLLAAGAGFYAYVEAGRRRPPLDLRGSESVILPPRLFAGILPVLEAEASSGKLSIAVEEGWLDYSPPSREISMRALESILDHLGRPSVEVRTADGPLLATCDGRRCRLTKAGGAPLQDVAPPAAGE